MSGAVEQVRVWKSVAVKLLATLESFKPLDELGKKRIESARTAFRVTARGTEIEPGEITCPTCAGHIGWEDGFAPDCQLQTALGGEDG